MKHNFSFNDVALIIVNNTNNNKYTQVSHDHHRSYERNLRNCVLKPEKVRTSTGFESVISRFQCDAITN